MVVARDLEATRLSRQFWRVFDGTFDRLQNCQEVIKGT
jgi:hypothetical protein